MKALGQYILSITSAAMIFGILKSLLGGKGTSAILLQLVGGLFLAFTIVTPIADIDFDKILDIQNDYVQILPFGGASGKDTADQPLDEGTIDKVFELFCARNRDLFELDE